MAVENMGLGKFRIELNRTEETGRSIFKVGGEGAAKPGKPGHTKKKKLEIRGGIAVETCIETMEARINGPLNLGTRHFTERQGGLKKGNQ